jgi:sulfate adenylyltransferase
MERARRESRRPAVQEAQTLRCDELLVAVLRLLAGGAFGDLDRFLTAAEAEAVSATHRLPDGRPCPVAPLCELPAAGPLAAGDSVTLTDPDGTPLAGLRITEVSRSAAGPVRLAGPVRPSAALVAATRAPAAPTGPALIAPHDADPAAVAEVTAQVQLAWPPHLPDDHRPAAALAAMRRPGRLLVTPWYRRHPAEVAHQAAASGAATVLVPPAAAGLVAELFPRLTVHACPALEAVSAPPRGPGMVVMLTGLSGSGKSTIARALTTELIARGRRVTLLDGDVVRTHLSQGLGFSREDRDLNIRRIGYVAAEVAKHGGIAVCAPIAPYQATRDAVRDMVERYGRFVLVHVATDLATCEARDVKGLYARARSGELREFTGVSDPYEVPVDAELTLDTAVTDVPEAVAAIVAALAET